MNDEGGLDALRETEMEAEVERLLDLAASSEACAAEAREAGNEDRAEMFEDQAESQLRAAVETEQDLADGLPPLTETRAER